MSDKKSRFSLILYGLILVYTIILLAYTWQRPAGQDEYNFLRNVLNFYVYRTIIPFYLNYPSFFSYLIFLPVFLAYLVSYVCHGLPLKFLSDPYLFDFLFQAETNYWIWTVRGISMLAAGGSLWIWGQFLRERVHALITFFILGILIVDPYSVYLRHAGAALPDMFLVLLISTIVMFCLAYLRRPDLTLLGRVSFLSGIAVMTKLNAVFILGPLLSTLILANRHRDGRAWRRCLLGLGGGLLIGSPALLIRPDLYAPFFFFEANLLLRSSQAFSDAQSTNILQLAWQANPWLTVCLLGGIIYALIRRRTEDIVILSLVIPALTVLSLLEKNIFQYYLFLYPFILFLFGRGCNDLLSCWRTQTGRFVTGVLILTLFAYFLFDFSRRMSVAIKPDNRTTAKHWITANIPSGAIFLVDAGYLPDIGVLEGMGVLLQNYHRDSPVPSFVRKIERRQPNYFFIKTSSIEDPVSGPLASRAEYFVTTDYNYRRYLTDKPVGWMLSFHDPQAEQTYLQQQAFYRDLLNAQLPFRLIRTFDAGQGPAVLIFQRVI